ASGACCHGAKTRNRSLCHGHRVHTRREQRLHYAGGHAAQRDRVRNRAGADAADDEGGDLAEPERYSGDHGALRVVVINPQAPLLSPIRASEFSTRTEAARAAVKKEQRSRVSAFTTPPVRLRVHGDLTGDSGSVARRSAAPA